MRFSHLLLSIDLIANNKERLSYMDITLMFFMIGAITDRSLSEKERQFAFKLYTDYYPLIRGKVCKRVQNASDRDDLIHNCYLRLLTHIDRLTGLEQPQLVRYIERVVQSCCYDFFASSTDTISFEETSAEIAADESENVPEMVEQLEMYDDFHQLFQQFPEREQRILYMRYIEELSIKEIAEQLHVQPESANTILCRIRKRARKRLSVHRRKQL